MMMLMMMIIINIIIIIARAEVRGREREGMGWAFEILFHFVFPSSIPNLYRGTLCHYRIHEFIQAQQQALSQGWTDGWMKAESERCGCRMRMSKREEISIVIIILISSLSRNVGREIFESLLLFSSPRIASHLISSRREEKGREGGGISKHKNENIKKRRDFYK